jgi:hypothetical protein
LSKEKQQRIRGWWWGRKLKRKLLRQQKKRVKFASILPYIFNLLFIGGS